MPITGRYFPGQKSEEKVFLLLRRHWVTYGIFVALFVFMLIPLIIFLVYATSPSVIFSPQVVDLFYLVIPAYLLIILGTMLFGFVDYYLDVYIVTNERIVDISQNGFFKRDIAELHLHQVQDVSAKEEGFFSTMFHYGDVTIQTAGERENFVFRSVPHPYIISKKIVDLHEAQLEESQREELELGEGDFNETFHPEVLDLARKRTKDFFRGREPLDTGVSANDLKQISERGHSSHIISGIESSKKENDTENQSSHSDLNEQAEGEPAKKNEVENKNFKDLKDEKELRENEEIDL